MKHKRVVIFDLFGTLVREISNEYERGLVWLKNEILAECELRDVQHIAEQFRREFMQNRTATYKEANFMKQLELFRSEIGFREELPLGDIEYGFFIATRVAELEKDVKELLQWLKTQGFLLFVMSNTIFSAATIKKYLETHGIVKYFEDVYTSGDHGHRKPGQKFFNSTYAEIMKHSAVKRSEIVFIGNSMEKDMIGAKKFGFVPVWISPCTNGFGEYVLDCMRMSDFSECKEYFENNYIRMAGISKKYSVADGPGNRIVIYTQGCEKHCEGCHNQKTWDPSAGRMYSIKELMVRILSHISNSSRNVTVSGGEPLMQYKPLMTLLGTLNQMDIEVCLYTGHNFLDVPDEIKDKIRYLKTGPYVHELRSFKNSFYGSSNQEFWEKEVNGEWIKM